MLRNLSTLNYISKGNCWGGGDCGLRKILAHSSGMFCYKSSVSINNCGEIKLKLCDFCIFPYSKLNVLTTVELPHTWQWPVRTSWWIRRSDWHQNVCSAPCYHSHWGYHLLMPQALSKFRVNLQVERDHSYLPTHTKHTHTEVSSLKVTSTLPRQTVKVNGDSVGGSAGNCFPSRMTSFGGHGKGSYGFGSAVGVALKGTLAVWQAVSLLINSSVKVLNRKVCSPPPTTSQPGLRAT